MNEMLVRNAQIGDAGAIAEVHIASWRSAYRGLIAQSVLDGLDVARRTAAWERMIRASDAGEPTEGDTGPSHDIVVAVHDARVVGFCSFGVGRDPGLEAHGEVAGIYVDPSEWGTGAGFQLMNSAIAGLRAARFSDAFLWVLDGNTRAINFYERNGWHDTGHTKVGAAGGASSLLERRFEREL